MAAARQPHGVKPNFHIVSHIPLKAGTGIGQLEGRLESGKGHAMWRQLSKPYLPLSGAK